MRFLTISSLGNLLLLVFLCTCVQVPAWAVPVDDLYIAEVLVADESKRQLKIGARSGLLQILIRVSGNTDIEGSESIRAALVDPSAYYYQFSYESTDEMLFVAAEQVVAKILRVHFEPSSVARLLRESSLPVWGSNRPAVLLWVVVSEGQDRRILGEADESPVIQSLVNQAKQRGIPLTFPILDLEDAVQISSAEVWGAFLDRIDAASTRYDADVILTARIQKEVSGRWNGRWSSKIVDRWESVETVAFSADGLVREMVDHLANELAVRYALGSSRSNIKLVVEGVVSLPEYAALSSYLEQLTPVLNSSIVALQGDVAEFDIQTEGQYEQLIELIELDQRLILLNKGANGSRLLYRWKE